MDLAGKVAVVTGSGRGLGLAYARELARCDAAVVVNDVDAHDGTGWTADDIAAAWPGKYAAAHQTVGPQLEPSSEGQAQ